MRTFETAPSLRQTQQSSTAPPTKTSRPRPPAPGAGVIADMVQRVTAPSVIQRQPIETGYGDLVAFARQPPCVQAKLSVGTPGDAFEQEADRMASWVVDGAPQTRGGEVSRVPGAANAVVQRLSSDRSPSQDDAVIVDEHEVDKADKPPEIQKLGPAPDGANGQTMAAPLAARLEAANTGGHALEAPVRDFMEQRFQHDFRGVRVHTSRWTGSRHGVAVPGQQGFRYA